MCIYVCKGLCFGVLVCVGIFGWGGRGVFGEIEFGVFVGLSVFYIIFRGWIVRYFYLRVVLI